MYKLIRPLLFLLDPENAHHVSLSLMHLVGKSVVFRRFVSWLYDSPQDAVHAFGLSFPNPIGIAAGYDKDGLAWRGLASLGFGHIEVGTVTPRPQPGNPRPRIFRLPEDRAIINRMGFPGKGADYVKRHLEGDRPSKLIIGVNLGVYYALN